MRLKRIDYKKLNELYYQNGWAWSYQDEVPHIPSQQELVEMVESLKKDLKHSPVGSFVSCGRILLFRADDGKIRMAIDGDYRNDN